jgi:hypothetical protein
MIVREPRRERKQTVARTARGKVAWKGDNDSAKGLGSQIRLYLTGWENPHPAKRVTSIDYVKVGDNPAAPFCVAVTLEQP